ncbi:tripartite motif-containing protein 16-like [Eleginops maclovinus]|uniref:tripartite motif-containing protein 16-like n=1 Tax=Eleginops maclovinus TaxID=56733 RepID=UPI003080A287
MAQQGSQLEKDKLCCSICLDPLKDLVTIPCGHSYCLSCIKNYWDEENQKSSYSCPQCRQSFDPRPVLMKNTMLADLVEEVKNKKTDVKASPVDHSYAGPGDVGCDFCTGRKLRALKSCLQCLVSYCEQHLQPHYESPAFGKHKLVDPSNKIQENICARHNEVMKIFCHTDQQCICFLCSMDEHKGHDTVSAAAEMNMKQGELVVSRQNIQQRIQNREKDVKLLQKELEAINLSADKAVRDSEKIFTEVKQQIRSRQESEVAHLNQLQEKLQEEIAELSRKDTELDRLSHTEDHTQFLQNYSRLSRQSEATDSSSITIRSLRYTEDMTAAVSEVRDKLQEVVSEEWATMSITESSQTEPKKRTEFLKYLCDITVDWRTKNKHIIHSYNGVEFNFNECDCYGHPDSFADWAQVLCGESLTGCCYWEVKVEGTVIVAVAYKSISRKGDESILGNNDKSWALECLDVGYEFRHNKIRTSISGPQSSRVGVYLDHSAGVLSFYSVSETMTLLHRVHTTFTEPICPGFGVHHYTDSVGIYQDKKKQQLRTVK